MQVFLSVMPRDAGDALRYHNRLAHMAYRVGEGSRLVRWQDPGQNRCGLLVLSDLGCPPIGRPEALCREVAQECMQRLYGGVLADFEGDVTTDRVQFLSKLCGVLGGSGRRLYLPERYALHVPGAVAVLCTAMSGGNFRQRLDEAVCRFGAGNLALDVERLAMDFTLPSPEGTGTPLTAEELQNLLAEQKPATFYTRELCARYFTYTCRGAVHFVLYDDADTIRRKIRTGYDLGLCAAFLVYPEVKELLPVLFEKK